MSTQDPFLSEEQILRIVFPLTQPAAIVRWFKNNGFPDVKARPNGMPLISTAYFDAVTAGSSVKETPGERPQLNVQAYVDRIGKGQKLKAVR